jgi:hypothetical protein
MTDKKMDCLDSVDKFFQIYKDNDYMLQRIYNHIVNILPNTLETEAKNYEKRINLNSYLSEEQQVFMQVFLSKNNYYYLPGNGFFYEYNGKDYLIVREDEIIHKLLSSISKDRVLLQWKHKTKMNVIKQIKERNLFSSIPETDTIQNVLNVLYPSIFLSKSAAKYFLTIIGDNILKKNTNLIFLVTQKTKQLLNELECVSASSIGNDNTSFRFITKYHENHNFENLRLLKINEIFSQDYWREMLKRIGLNLLCVASHYSNRYENSDKFLSMKSDEELSNYAYTLKNITQNDIVNKFISECLDKTSDEHKIEWKNLHFVWKQFLSNSGMPNVIFSTTLKNLLCESLNYDKETDYFIGVTSKYLPFYKDFLSFWESTITTTNSNYFENELEIDEISSLFKLWTKSKTVLTDEYILKILKYFFTNIEIAEDKFVLNITSNLWDKIADINNALPYIKNTIKTEHKLSLISFDDIYCYYQSYCTFNSMKFIVSKRYFEKYLYSKFVDYIVYEKFIKVEWINT